MKIIESRYYVGDIVEIISSNYKSVKDNPHNYEYNEYPLEFIGQRFRINAISDPRLRVIIWNSYINSLGNNEYSIAVRPEQLMLYKRPFRNWVKRILNIQQNNDW